MMGRTALAAWLVSQEHPTTNVPLYEGWAITLYTAQIARAGELCKAANDG
jgi:hypothetical protein